MNTTCRFQDCWKWRRTVITKKRKFTSFWSL